MLQDVINQVVAAENQAKELASDAEKRAYDIVMNAKNKAEEDIAALTADCKATVSRLRAQAEQSAKEQCDSFVKQQTEQAMAQKAQAAKNIDKAIKVIIGDIG